MRAAQSGPAVGEVEGLFRAAGQSGRIGANGDDSSLALPSGRETRG